MGAKKETGGGRHFTSKRVFQMAEPFNIEQMAGPFRCSTVNDAMAAEEVVSAFCRRSCGQFLPLLLPDWRQSTSPGRRRPPPVSHLSDALSTTHSSHSKPHWLPRYLPRNRPWDPPNTSRSSNSRSPTLDITSHVTCAT